MLKKIDFNGGIIMAVWKFPYNISEQEYIDFNEHFLFKIPEGKKSLLIYRLIVPGVLLLFLLSSLAKGSDIMTLIIQTVVYFIAAVLWWYNCHRVILFSVKRRLRKAQSVERSLFSSRGIAYFDFENRLIVDCGEREEIRVPFANITTLFETEKAYYLYFAPSKAFIVPYTLFRSNEEFFAFRELLYTNFPGENKS